MMDSLIGDFWDHPSKDTVARCNSVKKKTEMVNMAGFLPNRTFLKNWERLCIGSLTFLAILLTFIGNTTSQGFMNDPLAGQVLYQTHCLRCHGSLGDGKGPDAGTLTVPPRDFHTPESTAKNEYELRSIIIWGLVFSPMHNWGYRLTSQEIRNLISYIRQLAPYQPRI
jgi:hypothetical protein